MYVNTTKKLKIIICVVNLTASIRTQTSFKIRAPTDGFLPCNSFSRRVTKANRQNYG
jgi:hypothetical protein